MFEKIMARVGKLKPHTPGHFAPTAPDGLDDHRDKKNALGKAFSARIFVAGFEIFDLFITPSGLATSAEATGDSKTTNGKQSEPPPRSVHVSRAPRPRPGIMLAEGVTIPISKTLNSEGV